MRNSNYVHGDGKYLVMQKMIDKGYNLHIVTKRKEQIKRYIPVNIHTLINNHLPLTNY